MSALRFGTPRAASGGVESALVTITENPVAAANAVSLNYTSDDIPGIVRLRRGKGFVYKTTRGAPVRDRATLARIRSLAIPPAWTDVWICPDPEGHIQATGRDARGRKQYRYHSRWRDVRDETKYHRLVEFCRVLPRIRAAVERDLADRRLSKPKVLAAIVSLMERAQLRVGNEEYVRQNRSYGATTLRIWHAHFQGATLELVFRAKGGIPRRVRITDRRLVRVVRECHDLPGQHLFQYVDEQGEIHRVSSNEVNEYIREISGGPFTAKDYRTWAATLGAALLLSATEHPGSARECKRCIKEVLEAVADRLGHTPTICRTSYVHPQLLEDFIANRFTLARAIQRRLPPRIGEPGEAIAIDALRAIEPVVARYLDTRRRPRDRG